MSCENATLSLLLKSGDITAIIALVGVGVGSFLLGALAIIALRISRKPSPTSYLVDSKQDTYSHSVTESISNGVHDGVLLPPRSLSQTFVRHSLKPPMNMFNTKEKNEWNSLQPIPFHGRQNSDNPFGSIGRESPSSFASEGIPRFNRVDLVGSHHVHVHSPRIFDSRRQRDFATQSFSRSIIQSTIHETGSMPEFSVTTTRSVGEKAEILGYLSQDPAGPERNSIQRATSDPRIAHSGREKTKYKLSAHELRRMRTFSSSERDSKSGDRNAPVMEMRERSRSRRSRVTSTHLSESTIDPSRSPGMALRKQQESDLTRQNSQRAVVFYQEHANRHLSLPHGGPLSSSTVLPDSPSGAIGNFSFA